MILSRSTSRIEAAPAAAVALLLKICLGLASLLALASCGGSDGPTWPADNSLVLALQNSPTNLDPRVGTDQASSRVFELMLNGLVAKNPRGDMIPDLAESWEILDDGHRYRFHLLPGVRFHDERTLSADDVVWTFNTILDGTVATAKKGAFDHVSAIEAIDPLTVDFILREPFGPFLIDLDASQGIIPAGTSTEEMNRAPVGTGPFRFVERTPEKVVLERFENCFSGAPHLERIVLKEVPDATVRALELMKGSVQLVIGDLSPDMVPHFRSHPSYRVVEDPGATYAYLGFNFEDPILKDRRVRRALAHGVDRRRLVDTLWQGLGVVTETMLPPGNWSRNDEIRPYPYNPERARALLDEAGYPDPDGEGPLPRLEITYKTSTNEPYVLQAQIIQQMLSQIGVKITIRTHEFATFYADVRKGNFQIFSLIRAGVIDPNIFQLVLHSENVPPSGQNRGRYKNPEFDRLVEEGARLTSPEERRPLYLRVQEIFAEDLPYLSLYTRVNVAVMPSTLEGYINYPSGELYSLKNMRWNRD